MSANAGKHILKKLVWQVERWLKKPYRQVWSRNAQDELLRVD